MAAPKKSRYQYNVSIKHYLNTKLKPYIPFPSDFESIKECYPLYVQAIVKGQTTRLRSIMHAYVSEDDFELFKQTYADDLRAEKILIERHILELEDLEEATFRLTSDFTHEYPYPFQLDQLVLSSLEMQVNDCLRETASSELIRHKNIVLRAQNGSAEIRPLNDKEYLLAKDHYYPDGGFNPECIVFEASTWLSTKNIRYSPGTHFETITSSDHPMFVFDPVEIGKQLKIESKGIVISGINFLTLFLSKYVDSFRILRAKYPPEIWDFQSYMDRVKATTRRHILTVDDWNSNRFDIAFMNTWNNAEALNAIHRGIESLKDEDAQVKYMLEAYDVDSRVPKEEITEYNLNMH